MLSACHEKEETFTSVAAAEADAGDKKNEAESKAAEEKPYKAMGMAYIRFATEEKELFKLLFMRDRSAENINDDSGKDVTEAIVKLISKNTGLNEKTAYMLHLETWLYVHGIATMIATNYLEWDGEFISNALTDCYTGLLHRFKTKALDVIS